MSWARSLAPTKRKGLEFGNHPIDMSRAVDFAIYILSGVVVIAAIVFFARYGSPGTHRVFDGLLTFTLLGIPVWAAVITARKRQWRLFALAVLAEAITVSWAMARHESPLGNEQGLRYYLALFHLRRG
jgi:hypothetical protein